MPAIASKNSEDIIGEHTVDNYEEACKASEMWVTIPEGEDIGFLSATEEEKMLTWMGALENNLDVLNMGDSESGNH